MSPGTHVYPRNDEREHVLSAECWCQPDVEYVHPETGEVYEYPMHTHHSADCREVSEAVTGESVTTEQGWTVERVTD